MRWPWLVLGVALVVIGLVLVVVPVVPQGSGTVSYGVTNGGAHLSYYRVAESGLSLSGVIVVSVAWTAAGSSAVEIIAAACSSTCGGNFSQLSDVTVQTGKSGAFALDQPIGGSIAMGILSTENGSNASVTFRLVTTLSTVGSAMVVFGGALAIFGGVSRRKRASGSREDAPAPDGTLTEGADTAGGSSVDPGAAQLAEQSTGSR